MLGRCYCSGAIGPCDEGVCSVTNTSETLTTFACLITREYYTSQDGGLIIDEDQNCVLDDLQHLISCTTDNYREGISYEVYNY